MRHRNAAVAMVLLGLFFLVACQHARTGETRKTVNLTVLNVPSGCWGEPQDGIRSILINTEGIVTYGLFPGSFKVSVTFDTRKTSVDQIIENLSKGGYPVSGEPRWVDWRIWLPKQRNPFLDLKRPEVKCRLKPWDRGLSPRQSQGLWRACLHRWPVWSTLPGKSLPC